LGNTWIAVLVYKPIHVCRPSSDISYESTCGYHRNILSSFHSSWTLTYRLKI